MPGFSRSGAADMIDWYARCDYEPDIKRRFHAEARPRLRLLAASLGLPPGSFDLRSNADGIAASGKITLHHDRVYVQVSQPATNGSDRDIRCRVTKRKIGGAPAAIPAALGFYPMSRRFPGPRSRQRPGPPAIV